jgi:hypothetical protein
VIKITPRITFTVFLVVVTTAVCSQPVPEIFSNEENANQSNRLQQLRYGQALYQYYQDNPLASLEAIAITEHLGVNQSDKPQLQLMKGGSSLQLGMTDTANSLLESLLQSSQPESVQAQAWFWLAKSSFRQGLYDVSAKASEALKRNQLREFINQEQRLELGYQAAFFGILKQPENWQQQIASVPETSIWHPYLTANAAIGLFNQKEYKQASQLFVQAIESAKFFPEPSWIDRSWSVIWPWSEELATEVQSPEYRERQELLDRLYYSVGQSFVKQNDHTAAFNAFKQIQANSLYAEQGLLAYGWALANEERWGEAMPVWQHLMQKGKGLPALQATHALAYGFEQLTDFARAYSMLDTSLRQLENARLSLKEMQNLNQQTLFMQTLAEQSSVPIDWPRLHQDLILDLLSGDNQQNTAKQLQDLVQLNGITTYIERQQNSLSHLRQLLDERSLALETRAAALSVEGAESAAFSLNETLILLGDKVKQANLKPVNFASAIQRSQYERLRMSKLRLERLIAEGKLSEQRRKELTEKLSRLDGILGWELKERQVLQQYQHDLAIQKAQSLYGEVENKLARLNALTENPQLLRNTLEKQYSKVDKLSQEYEQKHQRTEQLKDQLIESLQGYLLTRMQQRDAVLLEQITATRLAMLRMQDASYSRQQQVVEGE